MVEPVERMLDLHKQLPKAKTQHVGADSFRPAVRSGRNQSCRP